MWRALLMAFCLLLTPALWAQEGLWGPNLMPNWDFEEVGEDGAPPGWTLHQQTARVCRLRVVEEGCAGPRCLALEHAPPPGQEEEEWATSVRSPTVPAEEGWYLVLFWVRLEGEEEPPAGPMLAHVRFKTGEERDREARGATYWYYSFRPPELYRQWGVRYSLVRVRPGETGLQLQVHQYGPRMLLDAVQVRRMSPPENLEPLRENIVRDSVYGGKWVPDDEATGGKAWQVAEGEFPHGAKIMGGTRRSELPGLYRATWRFQQVEAGDQALWLSLSGVGLTDEHIYPTDFAEDGKWQEFVTYFYYPFGTGSFYTWSWKGKGVYRFDWLKLEQLTELSYREAWDVLYRGVDPDRVLPAVGELPPPSEQPRAWVVWGLHTDVWRVPEILEGAGFAADYSFLTHENRLTDPLPDLGGYRLVVLSGAPARLLNPQEQFVLQRWVNEGGGLVVLGGLNSFGYGGMRGSFVEDLLPVSCTRVFDLFQLPQPAQIQRVRGTDPGRIEWLHQVNLREGANVLLSAEGHPVAVNWRVGAGRVVAIVGTPLGTPPQPFWEQPEWPERLGWMLSWAAGR